MGGVGGVGGRQGSQEEKSIYKDRCDISVINI